MSPAILSRFDLFFVLVDEPKVEQDRELAHHILRNHERRGREKAPPYSTHALLRYILFAKALKPKVCVLMLGIIS